MAAADPTTGRGARRICFIADTSRRSRGVRCVSPPVLFPLVLASRSFGLLFPYPPCERLVPSFGGHDGPQFSRSLGGDFTAKHKTSSVSPQPLLSCPRWRAACCCCPLFAWCAARALLSAPPLTACLALACRVSPLARWSLLLFAVCPLRRRCLGPSPLAPPLIACLALARRVSPLACCPLLLPAGCLPRRLCLASPLPWALAACAAFDCVPCARSPRLAACALLAVAARWLSVLPPVLRAAGVSGPCRLRRLRLRALRWLAASRRLRAVRCCCSLAACPAARALGTYLAFPRADDAPPTENRNSTHRFMSGALSACAVRLNCCLAQQKLRRGSPQQKLGGTYKFAPNVVLRRAADCAAHGVSRLASPWRRA